MIQRISKSVRGRVCAVVLGLSLLSLASVSMAQRQASRDQFRGVWTGTLAPDLLFGVPADYVERLSQPVNFELRVFTRGRAEVVFLTDIDQWAFTQREVQITEAGGNGAILGRVQGGADMSQNALSFNITKIDDETLLVEWSKISTRSNMRFDGLDELAFVGSDQLKLTGRN